MASPLKICFVFGTRPEAIKVAPVVEHFRSQKAYQVVTLLTAQHREMLDQVVRVFDLPVTHDLDVMTADQTLPSLTATLCTRIAKVLQTESPACVVVQGDTTSCFVGALAAFYHGIPVAHLEAGLRTDDIRQPFPEEMNRRLVSSLATYHFAPTDIARDNLVKENVPEDRIWVTGNSGVDALRIIRQRAKLDVDSDLARALDACNGKIITVTTHRRENVPFMRDIAAAIFELIEADEHLHVIFPVHLSPTVRERVVPLLQSVDRCHLLEPLPYDQFVLLMERTDLMLTDSGGIQEEAAYLGKPTLVMRRKTERPEAVSSGSVRLVGDDQQSIFDAALALLQDSNALRTMATTSQPFGDGHTSERVAQILIEQLISGTAGPVSPVGTAG